MLKICHRINEINSLQKTPTQYGVEIDLRSYGTKLVVHHDPFIDAVEFEEWIKYYRNKFIILNIKEEGIEEMVLDVVRQHKIEDFFLLDLSFPAIMKLVKKGEKRIALRISEYESIESALLLSGKIDWIWVDCFTKMPLNSQNYKQLKSAGFKICLVAPELQKHSLEKTIEFQKILEQENIILDAICTKEPQIWLDWGKTKN